MNNITCNYFFHKHTISNCLTLCFILCFSVFSNAQNNPDGYYRGIVTQNPGGLAEEYYMEMSLMTDTEGKAKGNTFFKIAENNDVFVKYSYTGYFKDNQLVITEYKIEDEKIYENAYFCYKTLTMNMVIKGNDCFLEGTWTSSNCATAKGIIKIKKENPN